MSDLHLHLTLHSPASNVKSSGKKPKSILKTPLKEKQKFRACLFSSPSKAQFVSGKSLETDVPGSAHYGEQSSNKRHRDDYNVSKTLLYYYIYIKLCFMETNSHLTTSPVGMATLNRNFLEMVLFSIPPTVEFVSIN